MINWPSDDYWKWSTDQELRKWATNAEQIQKQRINSTGNIDFFGYDRGVEDDALLLRVLLTIYGPPQRFQDENSSTNINGTLPHVLLPGYEPEEKKQAKKYRKKIHKIAKGAEKIHINVTFVSAYFEENEEKKTAEFPVFLVKAKNEQIKYLDNFLRIYKSWEDFLKNNNYPKCAYCYPTNGMYTRSNGEVVFGESIACSTWSRVKAGAGQIAKYVGLTVAVGGIVATPIGWYFATTAAIMSSSCAVVGTGIAIYGISANLGSIIDKFKHDDDFTWEAVGLFTSALGIGAQGMNAGVGRLAKSGKELKVLSQIQRQIVTLANYTVIGVSAISTLATGARLLWNLATGKKNHPLDYVNFAISLFYLTNSLMKPKTAEAIFEKAQKDHLKTIGQKVTDEEANKEFVKAVNKANSSPDAGQSRAYLIRNLNQIEDINDFFKNIAITGSQVDYRADGIVIDDQLLIDPRRFNQIGKFPSQAVQELRLKSDALKKEGNESNEENQKIQRQIDRLVKNFAGGMDQKEVQKQRDETETLKAQGKISDEEYQFRVKRCDRMANLVQKAADMKDTMNKYINNEIDLEKFNSQLDEGMKARRGLLFDITAAHRKGEYDTATFKHKITSFANGNGERFTFKVHVVELRELLAKTVFGLNDVSDLENIKIGDKAIFSNMNVTTCDRLRRVLQSCRNIGKNQEENDQNFCDIVKGACNAAEKSGLGCNDAYDFCCYVELVKQLKIKSNDSNYYANVAAGGDNQTFTQFMANINNLKQNADSVLQSSHHKWSSLLSAMYHYEKHKKDYGAEITIQEFLNNKPSEIFNQKNFTSTDFSQIGGFKKNTFATTFGTRVFVGFRGTDGTIFSTYRRDDK